MQLLYLHFNAQAVAVPALRKKYVEPAHALVPCNHVKVSPIEDVSHMELARRVRRRRVNSECLARFVFPVETVKAQFFPLLLPFPLDFSKVVFSWQKLHIVQVLVFVTVRKIKIHLYFAGKAYIF